MEKGSKDDSKSFGLSNWKNSVAINKKGANLGVCIESLVPDMIDLRCYWISLEIIKIKMTFQMINLDEITKGVSIENSGRSLEYS